MERGTMKILCLVRHAAAGLAKDGLDIRRPLSPDGRKQARRLAVLLADRRVSPDLIVASPADRAFETACALADALGVKEAAIHVDGRIYDASEAEDLLRVVRDSDGGESVVLLVGHQPVLGELTLLLVPEFSGSFPRGGAACIGLDIPSWKDAGFGKGRLLWFETP
jgi:phosphohistidine phosphatase